MDPSLGSETLHSEDFVCLVCLVGSIFTALSVSVSVLFCFVLD